MFDYFAGKQNPMRSRDLKTVPPRELRRQLASEHVNAIDDVLRPLTAAPVVSLFEDGKREARPLLCMTTAEILCAAILRSCKILGRAH